MAYPVAPVEKILVRLRTRAIALNLHTQFGLPDPFIIRHFRNRNTKITERPGIALRLVDVSIDDSMGESQWEIAWRMEIDVVVDLELPPEDSGDDVTGWNALSATANVVVTDFTNSDGPGSGASTLGGLVDDVLPRDHDPDEDSKPDDGRLAMGIVVLYRTPRKDLNRLLGPEENVI